MHLMPSGTWVNRTRFVSTYNASGLSRFGQETPVLCTTERQLAIPFVQSLWPTIGWISFLFLRKLMRKYLVEGMSRTEWTPTGNAKRLSACPRQILTHVRASLCFDQKLPSWLESLPKFPKGLFLVVVQWLLRYNPSKTSKDKKHRKKQNKQGYKH